MQKCKNLGEENGTNFDENLVENVLEENVTQFGESFQKFWENVGEM